MNDPNFNTTIQSAPTEIVTVTDLEETPYIESNSKNNFEDPINLGFEEISDNELYIKISGFKENGAILCRMYLIFDDIYSPVIKAI